MGALSDELRERATHCRDLANSLADRETRQTLLTMAVELDDHATELDASRTAEVGPTTVPLF